MPDRKTPPPVSGFGFLTMPSPEILSLANGIKILSLDRGDDAINSLSVLFRGGYGEADSISVQNLMAETVTDGSKNHSGEEIAALMEDNGSWFGVKSTDHHTTFSLYSLNRNLSEVLPYFTEIVFSPSFPEDVLEIKRTKLLNSLELNRQKVSFMSRALTYRQLFGQGHRLATIDSEDAIRSVTSSMLADNHGRIVYSEPPVIFLAGKITPDILDTVARAFEGFTFKSKKRVPLEIAPFEPDYSSLRLHHQMEGKIQNAVSLTIPAIPRNHPDYFPLRFAAVALGGYFGSRLVTNIREEKGYTYGISAGLAGIHEGGYITITSECANAYVEPVIEEVCKEISRLQTELIPDEEWDVVTNFIKSSLASTLDNPFNIMDSYLKCHLFNMPENSFEAQQRSLEQTTPEIIMEMASKYLVTDRMFVATAGTAAQ